jgi:hypothetical protein
MKKLSLRKTISLMFVLFCFSLAIAQTGTVTVKRELSIKTSSDGKISEGGWTITVTCDQGGKQESFQLTTEQYIKLGYYDAVHRAERAGAKVTFGGSSKLENINGVEIFSDVMYQTTTYKGKCPRPTVSV